MSAAAIAIEERRPFVVTGGASGIGWEACAVVAEAGGKVVSVDVQPAAAALPPGVTQVLGDIASEDTWRRVDEAVRSIDPAGAAALLACAGRTGSAPIIRTRPEDITALIDVNVTGTLLGMQSVLPAMLEYGDGAIVAVASVDSSHVEEHMAAYAASKAALTQLARTAAVEHARHNVRVNVVCPGATDTPLLRSAFDRAPDPAAALSRLLSQTPTGRLVTPREIAHTLLFLASPLATGLSGAVIVVDGGLTSTYDFHLG